MLVKPRINCTSAKFQTQSQLEGSRVGDGGLIFQKSVNFAHSTKFIAPDNRAAYLKKKNS